MSRYAVRIYYSHAHDTWGFDVINAAGDVLVTGSGYLTAGEAQVFGEAMIEEAKALVLRVLIAEAATCTSH